MTIQEQQQRVERNSKITKFIATLIRFGVTPFILMLWYYLSISIPFQVDPLTYIQAFMLMFGINLIKQI